MILACVAWPATALAYHSGAKYDEPPGAGGGGGLFYTGSRRDRGWDCTACHVSPREKLDVTVSSQPPELIADRRYQPGTAYVITVAFASPMAQLGLAATRSNFNAIAITTLDDNGVPAGSFSGFDAGAYYARGTSFLASQSTVVNETSWTFTWTAPTATTGAVHVDLAVVDGNGANSNSQTTLTDPLGDDTAMFHYLVTTGSSAQLARPRSLPSWALLLAIPLLVGIGAMLRAWRSPSSAPASSG